MLKDQLFESEQFSGPRLRYTNFIDHRSSKKEVTYKSNDHLCMFPCLGRDPQVFYFINSMMSVLRVVVYKRPPLLGGAGQARFLLAAIVLWH